jgi:polyisoprenyl-teichoic acid--peptidoglycan teichoic acid transferase
MALVLLLAACGQAVAAAPLEPATSAPAARATLVLAAAASATPLLELTASAVAVTPVPSGTLNTPTVAPSPAWFAVQAGASATATLLATATPTAQIKAQPTLGAFSITPLANATLVTPNPTAVTAQTVAPAIVNVLLIGTDSRPIDPTFRTDTLIVVSINKDAGTVSLLSIPRDLYVYIPTYGTARINLAFQAATSVAFTGGGPALLEQTILYNLGIPIQYYALVNFDGFRQVVDTLGGIDVPVNCQVTEYKLKDPTLDERVVANYDLYTQNMGVTHMDGALALWYARARPVGGDFFRGYRQRQVLRAMFHKGLNANILPDIPSLYGNFRDVVQTDMGLWDVMQFVPMAARLDDANIRSFNIGPNQTSGWTTPAGEDVLIPNPDAIALVVKDFLAGTAANQIARPLTWIQVSDGAGALANDALAIETLHNEGFGVKEGAPAPATDFTTIIDHSTSAKGSPIKRLQSVLHVADEQVISEPDANSPFQFQVILGPDYNSCPRLDWMDTTATSGSVTP